MKSLNEYGQLKELGQYKLHPLATDKGGIELTDHEGKIPTAFKEIVRNVTQMTMRGNFQGLYRIPCPAYIHSDLSLLDTQANNLLFPKYLR